MRWISARRKVVDWAEPGLPPFVKINPGSDPALASDSQPGDMSMRAVVEEFLAEDDVEEELAPLEEPPPAERRDPPREPEPD